MAAEKVTGGEEGLREYFKEKIRASIDEDSSDSQSSSLHSEAFNRKDSE
jgi:hypothetical protein